MRKLRVQPQYWQPLSGLRNYRAEVRSRELPARRVLEHMQRGRQAVRVVGCYVRPSLYRELMSKECAGGPPVFRTISLEQREDSDMFGSWNHNTRSLTSRMEVRLQVLFRRLRSAVLNIKRARLIAVSLVAKRRGTDTQRTRCPG